ncbi:hypothetical protein [Cognatiluteimonas profundi]|uniref:hypothetical protein n=1 Tax=Cognatiluteimonas profundi TaxID=2594501 RepID=UPI00131CDAE4|nr:hypothetical protein [Lysobacter profundi]
MRTARLVQRLRDHDWTAAVIELVIVIAGILIALQVSNFNQDRIDRARGDVYLRRIHADLRSDLANMASTRQFWNQVTAYQDAAIAHHERGQLVDGSQWKTLLAYYQASQLRPFELEDTSFAEMRDAGDLGLIQDERLRVGLAKYYRLGGNGIQAQILRHDPVYRVQVRGLVPTKVQAYIWTHCYQQLEGTDQRLIDCASPIPESEAAAILATLRASDSLLQTLRYWNTWLRVSTFVVDDAGKSARALDAQMSEAER